MLFHLVLQVGLKALGCAIDMWPIAAEQFHEGPPPPLPVTGVYPLESMPNPYLPGEASAESP